MSVEIDELMPDPVLREEMIRIAKLLPEKEQFNLIDAVATMQAQIILKTARYIHDKQRIEWSSAYEIMLTYFQERSTGR